MPENLVKDTSVVKNSSVGEGTKISDFAVVDGCTIGDDCTIWRFVNLYGCRIGDECMIGSNVEIQSEVSVGDRSRIQSHAFICSLVDIEEDVFVSHGAMFVNDRYPPRDDSQEWEKTTVHKGASVGTNATLMPVTIGENALVGAGSVVVNDVPPNAIVAGNPAEIIGYRDD